MSIALKDLPRDYTFRLTCQMNMNHVGPVNIAALPAAPCQTLSIFRNGTSRVTNGAVSVHPVHVENLKALLLSAVQRYGPFKCDLDTLLQTSNNPICHHSSNTATRIQEPIIGLSHCTICDHMILLPFHDVQKQSRLDGILRREDPYRWQDKLDRAVWHGLHEGHSSLNLLYAQSQWVDILGVNC